MKIKKRNGKEQSVSFDKITLRNKKLAKDLNIDTEALSQSVIKGLKDGISTREIDTLSCQSALYRSIYEPDYGILASRIAINDYHKTTHVDYRKVLDLLHNNKDYKKGLLVDNPLLEDNMYKFAKEHIRQIQDSLDYKKDYDYSFPAFCAFQESYFYKINNECVERPQHTLMRESLGIHGPSTNNNIIHEGNIDDMLETYKLLSEKLFTHASPTIFNAASKKCQLSSCFLLECPDTMLEEKTGESIPDCWKHCSLISKEAGGIGVDITKVRPKGSKIGTSGKSDGIIPLSRVFNQIARYVNQSGKRKGAISLYLEFWHPDIPKFLEIRLKNTNEEERAKDVFPALWMNDLFFKRLKNNQMWSFFCPATYPELITLYGEEWEKRYIELENDNKFTSQMNSSELWSKVCKSITESGLPYIASKDQVNKKSNQKNIGTITSSNLCIEVVQYHNATSIAVCNLASIALPMFVYKNNNNETCFDFEKLGKVTSVIVKNINLIIDKTYYPVSYCKDNNLLYRPMGIGVQGLADVFAMFKYAWGEEQCIILNKLIFECIYYHAVKTSAELATIHGSYSAFEGSPISKGILQYDMWKDKNGNTVKPISDYSWDDLKEQVKKGMRNSLLIALMPTKGTSQLLDNSEGFEPYTSNIYLTKVLAGDFPIINKHLYKDLYDIGMWNKEIVDKIIKDEGSVQNLDIPQKLKDVYKTVWEISQKIIIDMAADRGPFVCQTQSMNLHLKHPTISSLSSMFMYAHEKELKTLSYYTRSQAGVDPVDFNNIGISDPTKNIKKRKLDNEKEEKSKEIKKPKFECTDDVCTSCGS